MSAASGERQAYPHPHVNEAWLAKLREDIIDPALPIVEAHHHLWDRASGVYLLDELRADLAAGHNVRATVFIQCGFAYRTDGPPELRPVGETERIAGIAATAEAAGIRPAPASSAIAISAWVTRSTPCWRRTSRPAAAASRAFARAPAGMPLWS